MKKYILTLLLLLATTLFTPAQVALSTFDFNAKACDEEVKLLALFTGHTVDEIIEFMKPSKRYDFAYLDTMTIYPLAKEEAKKLKGRHSKLKIQNRDTLYFGSGLDDGPIHPISIKLYRLKRFRSIRFSTLVEEKQIGSSNTYFQFINLEAGDYALVAETHSNTAFTFRIIGSPEKPVISMKDVGLLLKSEMNWKVN